MLHGKCQFSLTNWYFGTFSIDHEALNHKQYSTNGLGYSLLFVL